MSRIEICFCFGFSLRPFLLKMVPVGGKVISGQPGYLFLLLIGQNKNKYKTLKYTNFNQ